MNGAGGGFLLTVDINHTGNETDQPIIHQNTFFVGSGELVAMIGSNGAGESTTIKAIMN
ncbi:ATP-binding cassette domain-containing protein [Jeotgalibacillus soli]|uniref:Multidrug ABC transporter ATP-binding protein n=1 Tax=Jeotgalibacillus soli TaxID=889306 RepID=A0A0C2R0R7_9BACL|nr:ATP-binding cassette domain-containing protein [Jeotgalibacillus soli]KIL43910.1 multidrug ABC transporter ATP-binding protein [Jeotgalibacillus soli]